MRGWLRGGLAIVAATVVTGVALVYDPRNLIDSGDDEAIVMLRETALVSSSDLGTDHSAEGSLTYGGSTPVAAGFSGVVTEVIGHGERIERGTVLWRTEGEPVVALFGTSPSHRSLDVGSVGSDVHQLEDNLQILGFDPDGTVTVDDEYTANTAAMVERWQEATGASQTGRVELGSVAFVAPASRVSEVATDVGSALAQGTVAVVATDTDRAATFTVDAADAATLDLGDEVELRLPDRSTVVAAVASLVTEGDGSTLVTAVPVEPLAYPLEAIPVTVSWSTVAGSDLLTVPASAVVRTDSGGYFVEVRAASGEERFVPIEVGVTSGLFVEVIGEVAEGDVVVAP